jgi:hypothetical protein
MIRRGRWKLVYQPLTGGYALRLFDLETDASCQHDVSVRHPEVTANLWAKLQAFVNTSEQQVTDAVQSGQNRQ